MPKLTNKFVINFETVDKEGYLKGRLELTGGYLYYYRPNARKVTQRYSMQQLIDLIEKDMEEQDVIQS